MAEMTRKELVLALAAVPDVACRKPGHLVRLAGVDLSGLDLRGLNLAHADLAGADLRGCDLSDARLVEADLCGADLTGAVLRGVFAEGATFVDARLSGADFRPSRRNLFYGTHLTGANFEGADLGRAASAAPTSRGRGCAARTSPGRISPALEWTRAPSWPAPAWKRLSSERPRGPNPTGRAGRTFQVCRTFRTRRRPRAGRLERLQPAARVCPCSRHRNRARLRSAGRRSAGEAATCGAVLGNSREFGPAGVR